jgi:hypothetical protein
MKKQFAHILIICLTISIMNATAQVPGAKIGSFDQFKDIGLPKISGSASYHEPSQIYHLSGSGSNIWFGTDSFSFLSKKMDGDFILQTQVIYWRRARTSQENRPDDQKFNCRQFTVCGLCGSWGWINLPAIPVDRGRKHK